MTEPQKHYKFIYKSWEYYFMKPVKSVEKDEVEFMDGTVETLRAELLSRLDGPAIIDIKNGNKFYCVNGKFLPFITNDKELQFAIKLNKLKMFQ